jgi:DNA polymerase III alpha subunit/nucleotidyltransferase/DNA polymerase involved in DNA repair
LRGKPVAVGGEKRGIIASASYEARKFGVYTPMPTVMARRICPKLIILPGDFDKYELFSRLMFSYAYDFTPDVEIGSIDEGYFDVSGAPKPALSIADTIRQAIRQSLKLSVSEGIGSNKLISQIASKLQKPAAFQFVPAGTEAQFLAPLANQWLPGIGPKTSNQLNAAGLALIGQIAGTPVDLLGLLVGSLALQLRRFASGIDERPVVPARAPARSYGEQETFAADTTDEEFLDATLRRMADKLMAKVRADGKSIRTVTVKVRYNDMDEEQTSESLHEPTDLETEIYSRVSMLLRKAWKRRVSLRLVSLRLSNVYDGPFRSALALDTAARQREAQHRLAGIVDELRDKFGRGVLLRGHDFVLSSDECRVTSDANGSPRPSTLNPQPSTLDTRHSQYQHAIVQRQRLGTYAARRATEPRHSSLVTRHSSPGPELRFRIDATGAVKPVTHLTQLTHLTDLTCPIPLNLHSYYSFLDSTLSIKAIIDLAVQHELPAIALTDKNNLHGAAEFAQAAATAGIKPIIGAELERHGRRACLYVENETGYHNLCRMLSDECRVSSAEEMWSVECGVRSAAAVQSSKFDVQSSTFDVLFRDTQGLLAVSVDPALAKFFPDRFYLQHSTTPSLHHSATPLPRIASFPVHYAGVSDRWKYDVVQSIRTLTLLRQQHPEKRLDGDYHFRAPTEMKKLFGSQPELLAHSLELAERCSFQFSFGKPQFPSYKPPDGLTPAEFLRRLVMEGLQRRYPKDHARIRPQLEEELGIITEVGYEEYFLVMWDILQECRRRGIEWITRGSAADSLACYCLGISSVCPIRFDLYFRRFLNKERMALNKLPDIDVDFPHDRKDDVIDLIFEKYGRAHTAVVGGFSTFQSRSAFAEVAKVFGVSEYQVRRLTERLPHFSRATELAQAVAETQECRDLPFQEEPYRTALRLAHFLDGFPRYPKMHPCGLVLSRQPMHEITPCFTSAKGYPTTHFDMDSIEAVGLIKMDILAQGGLAVMRDVQEMLAANPKAECRNPKEARNPKSEQNVECCEAYSDFELRNSFGFRHSDFGFHFDGFPSQSGPWNDPSVWSLIASGSARAVHHIESPAMISLCKMCNVHDIDTLIAIVSVIRPGAANESKKMEFTRRYQGLSPVRYPHPSLESCLRSTYGLVVYEEHILQICEAFAGLPPGRADVLRRALGKGKDELISEIELEFAACARRRGRTEPEIAEVWGLVSGFKGYAFCKAHSTAYGVEAYQSAWLKRYYPAEFMAAVLTNGKGFYDPLVYVLECHRLGIPLLPPSVNEPGPQFTVTSDGNPKSETRNPTRCDGATARREEIRTPKSESASHRSALDLNEKLPITNYQLPMPHPPSFHHSITPSPRSAIRVPLLNLKGLTLRTKEAILRERERGAFDSLRDFYRRVQPLNEEMQSLIQSGAFDEFGKTRTAQFWQSVECRVSSDNRVQNAECRMQNAEDAGRSKFDVQSSMFKVRSSFSPSSILHPPSSPRQLPLLPPQTLDRLPSVPLTEPDRLQRLRWEEELLGYPVSGHPLELYPDIAWETYCPINRLGEHLGRQIVTCGLVVEQRLFHQITGEPMKFLTIADRTGMVETELFARTYRSYGLNTVRYRVLEIYTTVEPFENGRGFSLRVLRAGKPRSRK